MISYSIINKNQLEGASRLDAEYYRPEYVKLDESLSAKSYLLLRELATRISRGKQPRYVENGKVFAFTSDQIHNDFIDIFSARYTDEIFYNKNPKAQVKSLDVLLNSTGVGTLGRVNFYYLEDRAVVDGHVTIIRTAKDKLNPIFLNIFLKTKFGQFQINRAYTGSSGQIELYPEHIQSFKIPVSSLKTQLKITNLVKEAIELNHQSESLYLQAEQMVLDGVGFGNINFNVKKSFVVNLSETTRDKRIDAEHFHTRFKNLRAHLRNTKKVKLLRELRTFIKRGLQPAYVEDGEIVVINSQHLGRILLNIEDTERTDRKFFDQNKRSQLRREDILFYSTGAYIGRTNIYLEDKEAIASNHVTIIRTIKGLEPIYLSVYLNSPLGLMQVDQWASGSAQREIYPDDIDKFLVYLPSPRFQQKIATLVHQSYEARKKAKQLLEEAKRTVEEIIEKGGRKYEKTDKKSN